ERLTRIIGEVYAGFLRVFPHETAGMENMPAPRVAILNTDPKNVNAYALGPGFAEDATAPQDKSPWLFVVHSALLAKPFTDNELRGLFAHEIGHLILRTFLPEIRQAVRAIYLTGKSEDGVLGANQDDNPQIASHVEEILKRQDRVSGLPELGLPT